MSLRIALALAFLASMTGCATVKETFAADGRKSYTLNCSGTARGWDKCLASAGEICKTAGYDVLHRNSEDLGTSSIAATRYGLVGDSVQTQERTMQIACKA